LEDSLLNYQKKALKEINNEKNVQNENFLALKSVLLEIIQRFEPEETYKEINDILESFKDDNPDLQHICNEILTNIGIESTTAKLLKLITQNIIFVCIKKIKTSVTKEIMTGDVRGAVGWQIFILFANDIISVTHKRREKSLGTTEEKSFWFDWVLHMTFDVRMEAILSATLRITDLGFSNKTNEDTKNQINNLFCNGDLLLE